MNPPPSVLIVDDKEENLYYLQSLFAGHGWSVQVARHGAEALVLARRQRPDLIVSDLLMPVMDGYTLLRHWKVDLNLKACPFVVYTATYTEPSDEKLALDLGADAFILKPAEPEAFMARIREVQARATAPRQVHSKTPSSADETALLASYSETLIRKLEEKTLQLEQSNRTLADDVARRERVERSLRESEERFRQLAENIQEVFWITNPAKSEMLYISPAYEKIWGRSTDALYRNPGEWIDAIHPEDRQRVRESATSRQARGDYNETYRIVRPDGEVRWVRDRAFPVANPDGEIYRVVGIAEDITQRKLADERLSEQAALLDKAQDAILVRDLTHRVLFWNRSAERLYGWKHQEALGRSIVELVYGKETPEFASAFAATLANGEWSGELQQITRAGTPITVESHWTLVRDPHGNPKSILVINTDITQRKKLEAQFLRTQRLESIGVLAGGIAHDLNNVLAPILMSLDVIESAIADDSRRHLVTTLKGSVLRATDLVRQVLSFGRGAEGKRMIVQPSIIVREIGSIARDTFPKSIALEFDTPRDLWTIVGDATQLHQVIMNLCVNARDAMPLGGRLSVRLRNLAINEIQASAAGDLKAGPYVEIEVADTGGGIPLEIRDKIFEPFFTTKEIGLGTGLGLPTALSIVHNHGGAIRLQTEAGHGTTFRVYFPANADGKESESGSSENLPAPRGNHERILVIDDELAVRLAAQMTLESYGYEVVLAANGAEGIAVYAREHASIAAVIIDVAMPVLDGPATIAALRAINPDVIIIAASGLPPKHPVLQTLHDFLPKPYAASALLTSLRRALQRSDRPSAQTQPALGA